MMKPRDPSSNAWACARAIELIGAEVAADVIERSVSLIYQWADPDNPAQPVLWQAQRLDDYCAEVTGEAPFFTVWTRRRKKPVAQGRCPLALAIMADRDVSELVAEIHSARQDGRFDAAERKGVNERITSIRSSLDAVETEVNGTLTVVTA